MFGYKVVLDKTTHYEYYSDEPYGEWGSDSDWQFSRVSKTDEYPDVASVLDISVGEECYVVWVQWGSGDSFGHGSGAYAEALGVFKDKESAGQLAEAAENLCNYGLGKYTEKGMGYKITTKDGQTFQDGFCSWRGYFDCLEKVEIETAFMRDN